MTPVYPPIESWVVTEQVLAGTLEGVRSAGRLGREAGVFWLGRRDATAQISAVVVLRGVGVEELPNCWRVSPEVFGAVTRWATPRNLCLLGVAHIHLRGVRPVLSGSDRSFGVRAPGVLSVVIGDAGDECDYRNWGWYVFESTDYRAFSQSEIGKRLRIESSNDDGRWIADANGVRPLTERL